MFTFPAPPGSFYVRMRSVAGSMAGPIQSVPSGDVRLVTVQPCGAVAAGGAEGARQRFLVVADVEEHVRGRPTAIVLDVTGSATTSIPLGLSEGFSYPAAPSGTYTLSVRAANDAGTSAASAPVSVTFPGVCAGAPGVPVEFIAYRLGSTIYVLWDRRRAAPRQRVHGDRVRLAQRKLPGHVANDQRNSGAGDLRADGRRYERVWPERRHAIANGDGALGTGVVSRMVNPLCHPSATIEGRVRSSGG